VAGLFISFEGIDGVGKSTQADRLDAYFVSLGRTVARTFEPGGTELGKSIRQLLLHSGHVDARAEALLYAADRAHNVATLIRPALELGQVVITDRYLDSSVAYQGAGRVLGADEVRDLSLWATGGLLPHLTVLLDLDAEAAVTRRSKTGTAPDRLESEKLAFFEAVRACYLEIAAADPNRFLVVDAHDSPDSIESTIRVRIDALLAAGA
jgi:dTMP kinase